MLVAAGAAIQLAHFTSLIARQTQKAEARSSPSGSFLAPLEPRRHLLPLANRFRSGYTGQTARAVQGGQRRASKGLGGRGRPYSCLFVHVFMMEELLMSTRLTRRQFVRRGTAVAASLAAALPATQTVHAGNPEGADTSKILNYNPDMEYRRCGRTGLMVSAVVLGGHWKRIDRVIGGEKVPGWMTMKIGRPEFQKNRYDVVTRCIERGMNYVDACCREEILAYARALKGRRDKMYFGYSWHIWESRFPEWRSARKLKQGLDAGMREAGLDYVDLWRISLLTESSRHTEAEIEEAMAALDWAKTTGRARFIGISSHDRPHLKKLIETYTDQIEVILTPYTAKTKVVTDETGLWATVQKYDVGWFGIKPFASNSLFKGDSSPDSPHFEEDNRIARLAIRCILCNPAITAPMPGLISVQQVDNVALAVKERRVLDLEEQAELDRVMERAWANLPPHYQWLKDWEYV
ncbi:MAG TPA: aldo/keto reductase [Planctomycetes bacterium]|nr:aldo/keto reductase [Planctomycetota bacterium]